MAQNTTTILEPNGKKRQPFALTTVNRKRQQPRLGLYIPPDVEPLLTPFRAGALQTIYEIAHKALGDRIKSVVVLAEADHQEPDQLALVLAIWAHVDEDEWRSAFRAISDSVFDEEKRWPESDRDDYINMIQFEILPLNV